MARDGAFRGMDACLCWHPSSETRTNAAGGSALDSLVFEFYGVTAHGAYPDKGRSALDAAVLTDVSVNYLREHVPDNIRIHSVIPAGGNAPNVVPEYARIWYYVRGKDRAQVDEISRRVVRCAKGAATATETRMKGTTTTGVYERLRNAAMAELVQRNLELMGAPRPTAADRKRVAKLGKKPVFARGVKSSISDVPGKGSSDEDNVSWLSPLGCFTVACVSQKVKGHNRELTAQTNLPFAHRGVVRAAEVLAGAAWDLLTNARALRTIRTEFRKKTRGFRYDPLIPKRQRPPVNGG
jgi:aminobenzoyl-glutamate utilization protein B